MTTRPRALLALGLAAALPTWAEGVERLLDLDLYTRLNPAGLQAVGGVTFRKVLVVDSRYGAPSASLQAGAALGLSPSTGQASLHAEVQPALFLRVRLQGDAFRYFGHYGALLSFPAATSPYGQATLDARKGEAAPAWGRRLLLQPTFLAKAGPVLLRNQTDRAWYRFQGRGPFFYDQEYDVLLRDGDALLANRTQALVPTAVAQGTLHAGGFFEWTGARSAHLYRRRLGLLGFWTAGAPRGSLGRPRAFLQAGWNLADPNRARRAFVAAGVGSSF